MATVLQIAGRERAKQQHPVRQSPGAPKLGGVRQSSISPKMGGVRQPPSAQEINQRRCSWKITLQSLTDRAGVHRDIFKYARKGLVPRQNTLWRLSKALEDLILERPPKQTPSAIRAIAGFVHLAEVIIGQQVAAAPALTALLGHRVPTLAIYLAAVEMQIENAELARALGCKRQNIHQLRRKVEGLRDDAAVDALLDTCAALMRGGPA